MRRTTSPNDLTEARARTLQLVAPLTDDDLHSQHDPLMSPIIWDLGHIAHFEELWLVRNLEGPVEFGEMPGIFNPFEHPRRVRGALQLPSLDECRDADARDPIARARAYVQTSDSTATIRCCATATCTRWCCSTSTSTTRRSCRRCSSSRARRTARRARTRRLPIAAGRRPARHGALCRRARTARHRRPDRAAYDNERPSHERRRRAVSRSTCIR